jgi:predicted nuclease of predicted toxin-antitoxin system
MQPDFELWLDTHISPAIAKWMADFTGFTVKSSYSLSLHYVGDLEIYARAREHGNVILISKDADFAELISRLGSPPKLINLKIGNCDNRTMWEFIKPHIVKAVDLLTSSDIDIIELGSLTIW